MRRQVVIRYDCSDLHIYTNEGANGGCFLDIGRKGEHDSHWSRSPVIGCSTGNIKQTV